MNPMQQIRIEKLTLNIGTGGPGEPMEKAIKLLKNLTGMKPIETTTKKRIAGWKLRPGLSIGCKITLRGKKAEEFFLRLLDAKNKTLSINNFDKNGNFSFGIPEYLDIPGAEYDIKIGIIGLETAVTLSRPGFRISKRRIHKNKIPNKIRITKEEAINFMTQKYSIKVIEEDDNK